MAGDRAEGGQTIVAEPGGNALARMAEVVGPAHAIADSERQLPYLRELRGLYAGSAALVLRPGSTREVAQILAIAHEAGIGIVPQGGNTGLVGGQIPTPDGRQVVLSLSRLNKRARGRRRGRDDDRRGGSDARRRAGRSRTAPTGSFRSACRRRAAARSAACWRPTPAASACWPTAMRAR